MDALKRAYPRKLRHDKLRLDIHTAENLLGTLGVAFLEVTPKRKIKTG
jgi:hypothetical protein